MPSKVFQGALSFPHLTTAASKVNFYHNPTPTTPQPLPRKCSSCVGGYFSSSSFLLPTVFLFLVSPIFSRSGWACNVVNLTKRAVLPPALNESGWRKIVCKGNKLRWMAWMENGCTGGLLNPPPANMGSQPPFWKFPEEFSKQGYKLNDDTRTRLDVGYYGLQNVFKDLGMSMDSKKWKFWQITQGTPGNYDTQTYVTNRRTY